MLYPSFHTILKSRPGHTMELSSSIDRYISMAIEALSIAAIICSDDHFFRLLLRLGVIFITAGQDFLLRRNPLIFLLGMLANSPINNSTSDKYFYY